MKNVVSRWFFLGADVSLGLVYNMARGTNQFLVLWLSGLIVVLVISYLMRDYSLYTCVFTSKECFLCFDHGITAIAIVRVRVSDCAREFSLA